MKYKYAKQAREARDRILDGVRTLQKLGNELFTAQIKELEAHPAPIPDEADEDEDKDKVKKTSPSDHYSKKDAKDIAS